MDFELLATLSLFIQSLVGFVLNLVQMNKGQFHKVKWVSPQKPKAEFKHFAGRLEKRCVGLVRIGVRFENKQVVKDRETEVGSLRWGVWLCHPFLITHKGKVYLRCEPDGKIESRWFLDGVEISREEGLSYLPPSESAESDKPLTMVINLEGITSINDTELPKS
jgi:hypothetical protein